MVNISLWPRLLLKIGDLRELWQYASDVLRTLLEHDANHRLDLLRMLTYFPSTAAGARSGRRQRTGGHANTVANQLQPIERLTLLGLGDPDDVLAAHLAIKIFAAQGVSTHRHPQHGGRQPLPRALPSLCCPSAGRNPDNTVRLIWDL